MESQIAFTFPSAVGGKFPPKSVSSMVLHTDNLLTDNHLLAAIVLLRDRRLELTAKADKDMVGFIDGLFVESIEELLALFKKHPTRPVFNEWLKQKGKEV